MLLNHILSNTMISFRPVYKSKNYNMKIRMALYSSKQVANCVKGTPYLSVFSPIAGKYGPEKTPCLDTFHAV